MKNNIAFIDGQNLYMGTNSSSVVLISGDGDFRMVVDFLLEENRFEKILFPNRRYASSLYNKISRKYHVNLDNKSVRNKIELKKRY